MNNFRAGVMERMGFGYDELARINPRIICAFGSGFGRSGPLAYKGGQDILAQALSGVMRRKCNDDEPLAVYATSLCDYTAGMHLVQAILLALLQREKTGRGQQVAVSLFESMLAMQMQEAAMWLQRGRHFSWGSYPLTGGFETTDGAIVLVGAFKTNPLQDICAALGLRDLSADQRYATFAGQVAHKAELQAMFRERFASNTTEYWLARLDEQDLLCAPVLTLAEALGHDQTEVERNGGDTQWRGRRSAADRHAARHDRGRVPAAPRAARARRRRRGGLKRGRLFGRAHRSPEADGNRRLSVLFSVQDHVARVTIDRPERHNAVDQATEGELIRIWETIEKDRDIRVAVLTGAGARAFCTGADMKAGSGASGLDYWAEARPGGFGGIALRDTLDVPVIARVNGYALGGGMEMMLGCDIVVASADASFGLPEPRVGRLALDGGVALLARRIPHVQAMGMLLTGRRIGADEAFRFGLVNEVVAPEALDDAVARWVADILACAPLSVRAIKQMVRAGERVTAREAQMLRLPALIEALQSSDQDEGVSAFKEKRAPQWRGR